MKTIILSLATVVLWTGISFATCVEPDGLYSVVDLSGKVSWRVVCETPNLKEAEKELDKQTTENCWVGKEQDETLYRVFCEYSSITND